MFKTESEYNIAVGKLVADPGCLSQDERFNLAQTLGHFEGMLDDADGDDYFGTEGWRHNVGWQ